MKDKLYNTVALTLICLCLLALVLNELRPEKKVNDYSRVSKPYIVNE